MLQDPSMQMCPVKHAVQQLSSKEVDTVFGDKYADRDKDAGESRFITLINEREEHLRRNIHRTSQKCLQSVNRLQTPDGCYSPDGSNLTRAEGSEVVVCDTSTGFVQKTVCGHR